MHLFFKMGEQVFRLSSLCVWYLKFLHESHMMGCCTIIYIAMPFHGAMLAGVDGLNTLQNEVVIRQRIWAAQQYLA